MYMCRVISSAGLICSSARITTVRLMGTQESGEKIKITKLHIHIKTGNSQAQIMTIALMRLSSVLIICIGSTVKTFSSCTSRPYVCKQLVLQTFTDNTFFISSIFLTITTLNI